jgi:hypothetical protein
MKKFVLMILLTQTILAHAQYEPSENRWEYYGELSPDINIFDNPHAMPDRILLFFTRYYIYNNPSSVLCYDTKVQQWQVYSILELFDYDIFYAFWYPHTKENYLDLMYDIAYARENISWQKLYLDKETVVRLEHFPHFWPNHYMPPDVVLDSNERLVSNFLETEKRGERLEAFSIYAEDGTELWRYSNKKDSSRETTVFWIGGKWLFKHYGAAGLTAGIGFNDYNYGIHHTILNYKTGDERNYFPEVIIGYGKDHIITTTKEMVGLTIRNLDDEIVYRDPSFKLADISEDYSKPLLGFAMLDYPYLYYPVHIPEFLRFHCTMVLNLETNEAHKVMDGRLLGIFNRDEE